jgi:hypothetical protein
MARKIPRNGDDAETITNEHANASVQDWLTTLKVREEDQTHQCQP